MVAQRVRKVAQRWQKGQRTERRLRVDMAQVMAKEAGSARAEREKQVKILAKSIFRELKSNGFEAREVVALSTELLSLLSTEIKSDSSK